jgi:hypothetical protein
MENLILRTIISLTFEGQPIILPLSGQIITEDDIKKNLEWSDLLIWMMISLAFISFLVMLAGKAIAAQEKRPTIIVTANFRKNYKQLITLPLISKHVHFGGFKKKIVSLSASDETTNIRKSKPI